MKWKQFNDQLAVIGILLIVGIWISTKWLAIPGEALGATIAIFTLIFQYYFRKAPPNQPPTG